MFASTALAAEKGRGYLIRGEQTGIPAFPPCSGFFPERVLHYSPGSQRPVSHGRLAQAPPLSFPESSHLPPTSGLVAGVFRRQAGFLFPHTNYPTFPLDGLYFFSQQWVYVYQIHPKPKLLMRTRLSTERRRNCSKRCVEMAIDPIRLSSRTSIRYRPRLS